MSITNGWLRIGGVDYSLTLTRHRQVVNGREGRIVVDPDAQHILASASVRALFAQAVATARRAERARRAAAAPAIVPATVRKGPQPVPVMVSGCFPTVMIPFPWWR